jgi:DNA-binding MarR family transcriptional regulator
MSSSRNDSRKILVQVTEPRFGAELIRLTRRCRGIDKYVSVRAALTIDEMHCLGALLSDRPSSVKRLSELINVGSTRASKILKDLETRGYVSRTLDSADRRKELVVLTEAGERTARRITALYAEIGSELLSSWRTELAADFAWLLQTVSEPK